jgi:hypothetical protein
MSRYMTRHRDRDRHEPAEQRKHRRSEAPVRETGWFSATDLVLLQRMADPKGRLRWLVEDFARRSDYRDVRDGKLLAAEQTPETTARELATFLVYGNGPGTLYLASLPKMPAKTLRELSHEIDAGVSRFLAGEKWPVAISEPMTRSISLSTVRLGPTKGRKTVERMWRGKQPARSFGLSFLLAAQELIAAEHETLARCLGCPAVFVRDDARQTYCRPECGSAHRQRRSRAKKRGLPEPAPNEQAYTSMDPRTGVLRWPEPPPARALSDPEEDQESKR